MNRIHIIFYFLLLIFFSCKKDPQITNDTLNKPANPSNTNSNLIKARVQGKVYDSKYIIPIAGAIIKMYTRNDCNITTKILDTTDINGNFNFYIETNIPRFYVESSCPSGVSFYVSYDGYFDGYLDINTTDSIYNFNVPMRKKVLLNVYINNVSPIDTAQLIKFWASPIGDTNTIIGTQDINGGGIVETYYYNLFGDTLKKIILNPNSDYTYWFKITKGSVTTDTSIDVHTNWGDSVNINVNY